MRKGLAILTVCIMIVYTATSINLNSSGNLEFSSKVLAGKGKSLFDWAKELNTSGDYTIDTEYATNLPVEFIKVTGNTVYSSDTFLGNSIADQKTLIIRYEGDLTINSGVTVTSTTRKRGMVIYVTGKCIINGTLTMTARGAANVQGQRLLLVNANGNSYEIPAVGGSGGARYTTGVSGSGDGYNSGSNGYDGQTGGGASGVGWSGTGGAGSAGTSYSGGSAGGAGHCYTAGDASPFGGKGGDAIGVGWGCFEGGVGNPGGRNDTNIRDAASGTGGLLILFVKGDLQIRDTGKIQANGTSGNVPTYYTGSGSGGGSVNVFYCSTVVNNGIIEAKGGNVGGGNGTARITSINNLPQISVVAPNSGNILNEKYLFQPEITVKDADNNSLICKYFIDSEAKQRDTQLIKNTITDQKVIFKTIDYTNLAEGNHSIKYEVSDGYYSAISIVNFILDRKPTLSTINTSSTQNSIKISGYATDNGSGLVQNPYHIKIGSEDNGWISSNCNELINSSIVNSTFDTAKNTGGKLVRLGNGWLISVVVQPSQDITWYKSIDNGKSWIKLTTNNSFTVCGYPSLAMTCNGTNVYTIVTAKYAGGCSYIYNFDAKSVASTVGWTARPDSGQDDFGTGCSIDVDIDGCIHAVWCSKNSQYPNCYNIRYSKSIDGGSSWTKPTQVSNENYATNRRLINPFIVIRNKLPVILCQYEDDNGAHYIVSYQYDGTSWIWRTVYGGNDSVMGSYGCNLQTNPCAVVSPDGSIHVCWQGQDSSDTTKFNIRYSKSIDGGITWSTAEKLTSGNIYNQINSTITSDSNNKIYIFWQGRSSGSYDQIRKIMFNGDSWGNITDITSNTAAPAQYPQLCANYKDFLGPLITYLDNQAGAVKYNGNISFEFISENLSPNTRYPIIFEAKDAAGNIATYEKDVYTMTLNPGVTATVTGTTAVFTKTDQNPEATQYQIVSGNKYITQNGALTSIPSWITFTNKTFKAAGLSAASNYTFTVRVRNGAGEVNPEAATVILSTVDKPLTAPSGLSANVISNTSVRITWKQVPGADGYKIEKDGDKVNLKEALNNLYYEDTGLALGSSHKYRVAAVKNGITGNWSSYVSVKVKLLPLNPPVTVTLSAHGTSIDVYWSKVDGATGYEIEADGAIKPVTNRINEYSLKGLKALTQHSIRIRTKNIAGQGTWSTMQTAMTTDGIPVDSPIITAESINNNSLKLIWSEVVDADSYDIMFDNQLVTGWTSLCFEKKGLQPDTEHSYKLCAKNNAGITGPWTTSVKFRTKLLGTPGNLKSIETDSIIILSWDAVDNAEEYIIHSDGQEDVRAPKPSDITAQRVSYTFGGLAHDTKRKFWVEAINSKGVSNISQEIYVKTLPVKPQIPQNVTAVTGQNLTIITWDAISGILGYDIELDGMVLENNDTNRYVHEGLDPFKEHTYRIRARNADMEGDWSEKQYIRTLPDKPKAPENIAVTSTSTSVTISWDTVMSAISYDIDIFEGDSQTPAESITDLLKTTYTHRKLTPGLEYRYRLRAHNSVGVSDWSGLVINNAIKAECFKDENIDLGLTAADVVDFSKYTLVVTYNPGVVSVEDLCTITGKPELKQGVIDGTDIFITGFTPGKIVFKTDKAINPGESWSGVINSIKFKAKLTGGTTVTYTVLCEPEE